MTYHCCKCQGIYLDLSLSFKEHITRLKNKMTDQLAYTYIIYLWTLPSYVLSFIVKLKVHNKNKINKEENKMIQAIYDNRTYFDLY